MEHHLLLIPLAKEYLEKAGDGPRCKQMIAAAIKCLTAVIHSKAPEQARVVARITLAKVLIRETGRSDLVENVASRGIQDAINARLYREKLELEVILATVSKLPNLPSLIEEAKALGDDALMYTLMLLLINQLWDGLGKDASRLLSCVRQLQQDQLLAMAMFAHLLEAIYWIERGNVEQTTRCLNMVDNEDSMGVCPPQFRVIRSLARVFAAINSGDFNLVAARVEELNHVDVMACNEDGSMFVWTFNGKRVDLDWLSRQDLRVVLKLVQGIAKVFLDQPTEALGTLTQAKNLVDKCKLQGMSYECIKKRAYRARLVEVASWYQIYAYFKLNKWNEGIQLLKTLPKSVMTLYFNGMFCHARGDNHEAHNFYALVRQNTSSKHELWLMAGINMLLLDSSSATLRVEIQEKCLESNSGLIQGCWSMVCAILDESPAQNTLTAATHKLNTAQFRTICSLLAIPASKQDQPIEQAFGNAYHSAKSVGALMWTRLALVHRRQRYLALANQAASAQARDELQNKAMFYDKGLSDRLDQAIMKDMVA